MANEEGALSGGRCRTATRFVGGEGGNSISVCRTSQQAKGTDDAVDAVEIATMVHNSTTAEVISTYPMDYYAQEGGLWNSSWHKK
jgi:hypothetical protein